MRDAVVPRAPSGAARGDGVAAPAIEVEGVAYAWPGAATPLFDGFALHVARGERVFLAGASGAGKSTLLGLLTGVVVPQRGDVRVLGTSLPGLRGGARDRFRADHVGYVFQMFNLIPYLSVLDNVCLPCGFSRTRAARARAAAGNVADEARRLLASLDLGGADVLRKPVTQLSVGQQQRVAAARALIGAPEIVIADEPTSALDADRRMRFLDLLFRECARGATTLVFASHDTALAPCFDRTLTLRGEPA